MKVLKRLTKITNQLMVLSFLLLQACTSPFSRAVNQEISTSYYYESGSENIIYSPMGNWFALGYDKMDADEATFQPIAEDFGKDKNQVYYKSLPQEQADLHSFQIEDGVIKDKNHVYDAEFFDLRIVEGADPASFRYMENDEDSRKWAKDDYNHFLYHTLVQVDYKSFRELKNGWIVDKDYIYKPVEIYENEAGELEYPEHRLEKTDTVDKTVENITNVYARMGNKVYSNHFDSGFKNFAFDKITNIEIVADQCIVVDGMLFVNGDQFPFDAVDVMSFENIEGDEPFRYSRDKNHIYYEGKVLPDADLATFQIIKWGYSKDKKYVYFLETIVEGADPGSFRYDEKKSDFVDAKNIYRFGKAFKE